MELSTLRQRHNANSSDIASEAVAKKIGGTPYEGASLPRQLVIMLRRNFTLMLRYRKSTLLQVLVAPLMLQLLLFILQKGDHYLKSQGNLHPDASSLGGLVGCQGRFPSLPCINLLYTPDNEVTRRILSQFDVKNKERTGRSMPLEPGSIELNQVPSRVMGMVPVKNAAFIYDYTLTNPNTTAFGIEFNIITGPPANYRYQVWYNNSLYSELGDNYNPQIHRLIRGIDEAIGNLSTVSNGQAADITVDVKPWPKLAIASQEDSLVTGFGAMFSYCTEMIIFIAVINMIVSEKEQKLRESMAMMGLSDEIYWLSWWITNLVPVLVCALVTCLLGLAFRFEPFVYSNFAVMLITFFLFGMAMVSMAFFISTFIRRTRVAVICGIFLFLIGLLFESMVFSNIFVGYIWWAPTTDSAGWIVLMFIPFFNFGKLYLDISRYTAGKYSVVTGEYTKGLGFPWSRLYEDLSTDVTSSAILSERVPRPIVSWYLLIANIGFYLLLTWYFDKVIPSEFGQYKKPWFFLTSSYWGFNSSSKKPVSSDLLNQAQVSIPGEDEDVQQERTRATDMSLDVAIRVLGLNKLYRNSWFKRTAVDKMAVHNLTIGLREGELFALLGQNGAGKSTTMNILSGLTPATRGDAYIFGFSVRDQMSEIRRILGVCPQHDLLFNDLSAMEHISLYAGLKGVPDTEMRALAEERLGAVRLWDIRHRPTRTYSGGMKRRLSVIISTLGDPKVIFMDEPTTGMDPVNRRHIWAFLESFKQGRVIVLTTHSMEEADVLGDQIAIMALGKLRALGSSIHLKNHHGTGYRITLMVEPEDSETVHMDIQRRIPGATLTDNSAGALIYQCSPQEMSRMPELLRHLESRNNQLIRSWGVSQTTLEEVFLLLIRGAMEEAKSKKKLIDSKKE
ncbi:hypothetical protein BDF19DRAFT_435110 [Syncephalis fuscata]|nr:hypothetical protein BDF19DRAFT_435110 [Syncephalis fuscata]